MCECVVWCPAETNENCGRGRVSTSRSSQGNGGAGPAADPNESHDS